MRPRLNSVLHRSILDKIHDIRKNVCLRSFDATLKISGCCTSCCQLKTHGLLKTEIKGILIFFFFVKCKYAYNFQVLHTGSLHCFHSVLQVCSCVMCAYTLVLTCTNISVLLGNSNMFSQCGPSL